LSVWRKSIAILRWRAILERLVHYKRFDVLEPHVLYLLDIPEAAIEAAPVPRADWDAEDPSPAAQAVGNAWCDEEKSPARRVPSGDPRRTQFIAERPSS
jgi:hypothetical protein